MTRRATLALILLLSFSTPSGAKTRVTVGSKNFNEGYVLAEIVSQLLESRGIEVERRFGLGGTLVCYQALRGGQIDVYPEYSGTLAQAILKSETPVDYAALQRRLYDEFDLRLLASFGFNNTYAIALKRERAEALGVRQIGDLADKTELRLAFSHEFINRNDGWPGLAAAYGLTVTPRGIEHGLAYQAVEDGKVDVTDVYSTDGDIQRYDLVLLEDNLGYFPRYMAAPLVRADVGDDVIRVLELLAGRIGEKQMQAMNRAVVIDGHSFAETARDFLASQGLGKGANGEGPEGLWSRLLRRTVTHLKLTFLALFAALVIAVPLGIFVYRAKGVARAVIYVAGMLQTVPSIALLAFMIPLLGIGAVPAVLALFLYALLPILRNTATALYSIDPVLKKVALGMGFTSWQRLRFVELPLAAPTILAGIKTAAVINIGTATLAAFIGAGGLGEPIVTGLALNDTSLILEGAVPAAILAILVELLFETAERLVVPRHLIAQSD